MVQKIVALLNVVIALTSRVEATVRRFVGWFTPARRKRLYKTASALLLAFIAQGVLTDDQARSWLLLMNLVLGMADANVDTTTDDLAAHAELED